MAVQEGVVGAGNVEGAAVEVGQVVDGGGSPLLGAGDVVVWDRNGIVIDARETSRHICCLLTNNFHNGILFSKTLLTC